MITSIETWDKQKCQNVKVGFLRNKIFIKKVLPEHYMRHCKGYGIQEKVIQELQNLHCQEIHIITARDTYKSKLLDWLEFDIKVMDFGSGEQRFLPIARMKKV